MSISSLICAVMVLKGKSEQQMYFGVKDVRFLQLCAVRLLILLKKESRKFVMSLLRQLYLRRQFTFVMSTKDSVLILLRSFWVALKTKCTQRKVKHLASSLYISIKKSEQEMHCLSSRTPQTSSQTAN